MKSRVFAAALMLAIAGCESAPTHYFRLVPAQLPVADLNARGVETDLDSVTVPEVVDRMQLVVSASPARVRFLQHARWVVPLRDQIATILLADLRAALQSDNARSIPPADVCTPVHLSVEIERFEADPHASVVVEARWRLRGSADARTARVLQPLTDDSPEIMVLAWSAALRALSTQIAQTLCTEPSAAH